MLTNKEDNISEYTDRELYQILDVNNPTDRELEAKINQLLDQYENTDMTMYKFITKIYHHFFEIESDSEAEIPVANNIQEGFGEREESIIPTNLVGDPDKFDGTLFRGQNTPDPNSMINKSGIITNLQLENNPNDPNNQQIIYQRARVIADRLQMNSSQLQTMYFEAVRNFDNLKFSLIFKVLF